MAQHIELENFRNESWYPKLIKRLERLIGKQSEYYSVWDSQCSQYFHSGRNSKTKLDAMNECAEMLIDGSGDDQEHTNELYGLLQRAPEEIMDIFDAEVRKHEFKIINDDDEIMQKLPDEYAYNGGEAYMYRSNIKAQLAHDEPNLRVCDCAIEIHLNRDIEPKKQIYLVA